MHFSYRLQIRRTDKVVAHGEAKLIPLETYMSQVINCRVDSFSTCIHY